MVLQCPHQGAQNLTRTSLSVSRTYCLKVVPTTTFTCASLVSGAGADLKKGATVPAAIYCTKVLKLSTVMSPVNLNFQVFSLRQRTWGVEEVSTPRYSASLSKRPWPSASLETVRMIEGLVSSKALNVVRAAASSVSSPTNRKRAAFFYWKIFSMAELSKGITAELMATIRRANANNFIKIIQTSNIQQ